MGYLKSLDDYSTSDLLEEIARRDELVKAGRCPYCRWPFPDNKPPVHGCKYAKNIERYHHTCEDMS